MAYITEVKVYRNHEGIEIHEENHVSGTIPKGKPQYTALVNISIKENPEDEGISYPVNASYHAIGIEDAFKKAKDELNKKIKELQEKLIEAKRDSEAPRIIT